ncbi:aminodeoxychorismate synthase component I [Streptomyces sp. NPDC060022]|uniref:aminodeoxychorismate synthase component I n=1 Tax=Streptomyces sp. NPDC060022 TaxID=3347039 RepID=UPI0036B4EFEA
MKVLLIDNYDSYTFNLAHLMAQVNGSFPRVVRNDSPELLRLDPGEFDAVAVSPGPGRPDVPGDVGLAADLLLSTRLPVLGVCLGHQMMASLSGASVVDAPAPRHGHVDRIRHDGAGLFAGLPQEFAAVRYHSLCVRPSLPAALTATAWSEDGVVMGLRHAEAPWYGVQFHPESIATDHGALLLRNFRRLASPSPVTLAPPRPRQPPPAERPRPEGRLQLRYVSVEAPAGGAEIFTALHADNDFAFWLDSSRTGPGQGRFSYLGDASGPLGEVLTYRTGTGRVEVSTDTGTHYEDGSVFDVLEDRLRTRAVAADARLPFDLCGGYVGYFGYELKGELGGRRRHRAEVPDAVWISATRYLVLDHLEHRLWAVALAGTSDDEVAAADQWITSTLKQAQAVDASAAAPELSGGLRITETQLGQALARPHARYLADVREIQRQLRRGESYEVCLTNRLTFPFDGTTLDLYRKQREANPAPYAAYLRLGDTSVLCSSPERFLRVGRDRVAESKPIKGTVARHPDPEVDAARRAALRSSAKDRAENLMIVDLLRNDLGRVCEAGSVSVPAFMEVESYETVHQLVSTVRGSLASGHSALSAVRACFPGGSMTGAPKLRTLDIIDSLENEPRGIYSGALGYFGLNGTAELNIVIRTAIVTPGLLTVGAGGAVVLASDPEAEYEEMLLKAKAPLLPLLQEESLPEDPSTAIQEARRK